MSRTSNCLEDKHLNIFPSFMTPISKLFLLKRINTTHTQQHACSVVCVNMFFDYRCCVQQ